MKEITKEQLIEKYDQLLDAEKNELFRKAVQLGLATQEVTVECAKTTVPFNVLARVMGYKLISNDTK